MEIFTTNEQRTAEYLKYFDREKLLKYLIKNNNPVIFDVGANNGSSVAQFKKYWPEAILHCFEPQEECWTGLEKEANLHALGSIFINKVGAGSFQSDGATFYTHDLTSGQSGFNKVNTKSKDSIRIREITHSQGEMEKYESTLNHPRQVPVIRLDSYISNECINKINLLKIDTQGYEPEVLSGLGSRLSDIDVVLTELMFYDFYDRSLTFSDIEEFLLPAGFRLYDISHISKNPMNGRTDWVDVIYLNERVRMNLSL